FENAVTIKLRSQANLDPSCILSICENEPRTIFIIRDFISWAVSRWRAFGFSTAINIDHYTTGLHALRWLSSHSNVMLISYKDISAGKLDVYSGVAKLLGVERKISSDDVAAVLAVDAQQGTKIAQNKVQSVPDSNFIDETRNAWDRAKPQELMNSLGIGDL